MLLRFLNQYFRAALRPFAGPRSHRKRRMHRCVFDQLEQRRLLAIVPQLLRDIQTGSTGSSPISFTEFGGRLFFSANDGTNGAELWASDGTSEGTAIVANIRSGASGSYPARLANVNGTLFLHGQ